MKFLETHFEEYINAVDNLNLHPKLDKCLNKFPDSLDKLGNLIYYGPSGVGKYSQMLHSIKKYSPTDLKYEKKLSVTYDKKQYFFNFIMSCKILIILISGIRIFSIFHSL